MNFKPRVATEPLTKNKDREGSITRTGNFITKSPPRSDVKALTVIKDVRPDRRTM